MKEKTGRTEKNKSHAVLEIPSLVCHENNSSRGLARNYKLVVICHNIRSAHNVGSVFRTADGAGAVKIFLSGYTPAPPHQGISKTALGAEEWMPWEKVSKLGNLIEKIKKDGFQIVALEKSAAGQNCFNFRSRRNIALILGNEVRGISKAILKKCDGVIEIPMRGKKESLNVSVAFGIAAYAITKK